MIKTTPAKEYLILVGSFGSGKSELSLHFASAAVAAGQTTTLIDLDIINPYFRVSERRLCLEKQGIRLITPNFAMSNVEIITINPEIYSAFSGTTGTVIFDVGGDNIGARVLGQYKTYFDQIPSGNFKVWLVVNPHRPFSSTAELVIAMLDKIEESSRLHINGLINNGNLSYETQGEDLLFAYEVIKKVSQEKNIPVVITSGEKYPLNKFLTYAKEHGLKDDFIGEPIIINTRMHRDWKRFVKNGV